jgi:hypothetical protein
MAVVSPLAIGAELVDVERFGMLCLLCYHVAGRYSYRSLVLSTAGVIGRRRGQQSCLRPLQSLVVIVVDR